MKYRFNLSAYIFGNDRIQFGLGVYEIPSCHTVQSFNAWYTKTLYLLGISD